jgi:hypothetical protein
MDTISDASCIASFARKKRLWIAVALPTAVVLLFSIFKTARGESYPALQLAGLCMLAAFLVASAVLCRCPRCRAFVFDRQSLTPGWGLHRCPHCAAPLKER